MEGEIRRTGIDMIGDTPWGTHLCQFYQTKEDLIDILVPYFKAGLENNELCMWVTSEPLKIEDAKRSLKEVVEDLDNYIEKGQIEILDASQWYTKSGKFEADKALQGWVEKENQAIENGFDGLRLTGNTFWLEERNWRDFVEYEAVVNGVIGNHRMLAICSYYLDKCGASEVIDVVSNHQFALIRRRGEWDLIESSERKRAENALRESEEKYRDLVENVNDVIFIIDENGVVTYVSPAIVSFIGYDPSEVIGRSFVEFAHQEDVPRSMEGFKKATSDRSDHLKPREYRFLTKSGEVRWARVSSRPIFEGNRVIGLQGVATDITERRRVEEALKESEQRYRSLAENIVDILVRIDMQGKIVYMSKSFEEETGYSREEAEGSNIQKFLTPESHKTAMGRIRQWTQGEEELPLYEIEVEAEDGHIVPFELRTSPVIEDGKLKGIQVMGRNIAERKQAEEALRESEEKYRHIAENPIVGVGMAQDGTVIYVNDAYCRMFGYEKDELVGESELKVVAPEDHSLIEERTRKRLEGEKVPKHYVFRGMRKDGTGLFIEVSSSEPFVYKNKPTLLAVFRDITEKRKMEEELLKADKLESVGVLAGGIAHDFNNILTAILGNVSLARMLERPEDKDGRLSEAERACIQARDLTQQLLTFSKGGAPVKKTASIAEILRDAASFALRGSNVRCEFSIPDGLWPAEVDTGQISQVISNMVINADHAMPQGGVVRLRAENLTVEAEDGLPLGDGEYVKMSVEDQGIGIPEEHLQRIFDPYFTTKQKGSGLGLATSYSIIKNHDGYITAESQVGVGTTFYIYLPASPGKTLVEEEKEEEKPITGEGRILVMDDEKHVRDTAAEMLSSIGYNVGTSIDGHEAIEMYKKAKESGQPYDAVIVDIVVPGGMGGKETVRKLIEIDHEVKAIVSSGYSNDPIMAGFREYGFNDAIAKPYKIKEMGEVLYRVINGF